MFKRFAVLLLAGFLTAGCGKKDPGAEVSVHYLEAVILEVSGDALLVEPVEGSAEQTDRIWVSAGRAEDAETKAYLPTAAVGDRVRIGYDGLLAETYPEQLNTPYTVTLLERSAETAGVSFTAQYIRTDGYREGVRYPVVTVVGSAEELARYIAENEDLYDLGHRDKVYADSSVGFADAAAGYDEAWFASHQLLIVLLEEGSGSVRHEVTCVTAGKSQTAEIARLCPEIGTADMAEWHILIETERVFDPAVPVTVTFVNRDV